jgi:hypothetical protein
MNTSMSLGSAAEFGTQYSASATSYGRLTASVDAVATALATAQLKVTTEAMRRQFSSFNQVFNALA